MSFSVLVLTLNEEANIVDCLKSIEWCDDIVVLDSGSTDATIEKAKEHGCRILQREFDNFANQRNFGLEQGEFKHEWVFHLDADERFTPELREECSKVISEDKHSGYFVPSRLMFKNKWLKHAGQYPVYQMRLLKLGELDFIQTGHGQREGEAKRGIGHLRNPYTHFAFTKGMPDWWEKHKRYAKEEAIEACSDAPEKSSFTSDDAIKRRRALKRFSYKLPCRGMLRFINLYCFNMGFLDGQSGLEYCRLISDYERLVSREIKILKRKKKDNTLTTTSRFLLVNQFYPPDHAPTGQYLHDIARYLMKQGHSVSVICSQRSYDGGNSYPASETIDGVEITRIPASGHGRKTYIGKLMDYLSFYTKLISALQKANPCPDIILALSTPPFLGIAARYASKRRCCSYARLVMDIYPDVMVSHGMINNGSLLHNILSNIARSDMKYSSANITIGKDMQERLLKYTGGNMVHSIPLWSRSLNNNIGTKKTSDETIFMYSGNMGLGHMLNEFLEAADRLKENKSVLFVFAGNGKRRPEVDKYISEHPNANIELLPYAPHDKLKEHLASADVHLASLNPDWDGCMLPSKIQGIFASGRPVIFVGSKNNSIADWITESGGGWITEKGDIEGLLKAVTESLDPAEREKRGNAARDYALNHFSMETNCRAIYDALI